MLVHDTGLRDDLGYVDLLLLSHRNRDLDTRLALAPPSMRGSKSGGESGHSRSAEDTKAVLVTSLSAWFLEASVPGLNDLLHRLVTDAGLRNDLRHMDLLLLRHGDRHLTETCNQRQV